MNLRNEIECIGFVPFGDLALDLLGVQVPPRHQAPREADRRQRTVAATGKSMVGVPVPRSWSGTKFLRRRSSYVSLGET